MTQRSLPGISKTWRTPASRAIVVLACVVSVSRATTAQQPQVPTPPSWDLKTPSTPNGSVVVLPVQGKVSVVIADGSNIAVQVGPDGVVVVDTSTGKMADQVIAAIQQLSDQPIRWIINTSAEGAHTGGNEAFFKAGRSTPQNRFASGLGFPGSLPTGATIVAHESVLLKMSAPSSQTPQAAWPTATFFGDAKELHMNGEPIQVLHQPKAHSDGDSFVVFRHSDVVSTGDIFSTVSYPTIDVKNGGTVGGVIDALNTLLDITFPREKEEGGTYVIPGHGRISDEADVVLYRNMVTILRDRIQDLKGKGMTLAQVQAAKPTADYDPRWATPSWTADMFVEAVYKTLTTAAATEERQNTAH